MLRNLFFDKSFRKNLLSGNQKFIGNINFSINNKNFKLLKTYDKSIKGLFFTKKIIIPADMVGQRIFYHTGKGISSLKITSFMVGYKLGEFLILRLSVKSVKKINKK